MARLKQAGGCARLAAFALTAALWGCAPPPPPPPPTVVSLTLAATADANAAPGAAAGAPVALRVYQLAATSAFTGAEFFQVFNQDQAALGADLVKRDDLIVAPGARKTLTLTPPDTVKAIGVFAAYRDYQGVVWRVSAPVSPHATTTLAITAGKAGLALAGAPGS